MKTLEELAGEYIAQIADSHSVKAACEKAFKAGYHSRDKEIAKIKIDWDYACSDRLKAIQELAEVERKIPEWISVKDRLPGKCLGLLIVYNSYLKEIGTSYYDKDMWCATGGEYITHWMPLPEPPKEEA